MAQRSEPMAHQPRVPDRHERPEDWGWHGSFGRWARIGGWVAVVSLVLMNVSTYYNTAHAPWLFGSAALLVLILVRDRFRRRNAWRQ
jgi:hypothetical protein